MFKRDVKSSGEALAYMIDCTLATVGTMARKKSRSQYDFERQISIAQTGIDWAREMNVDLSETRAHEVGNDSVKEWANKFDVRKS